MIGLERADFLAHFIAELVSASGRREFSNTDELRFPGSSASKGNLKDKILRFAASQGFHRAASISDSALRKILRTKGLDAAYGLFQDQLSRELFVKLLVYRVLGPQHVRLPLNNKKYWEARRIADTYRVRNATVTGIPVLGSLDFYDFEGVRLHGHLFNILNTFLLEQYRCARGSIGVQDGDVVVDAGGCWGDTALYFAQRASKVFCFECVPSNLKILDENLTMNEQFSRRIKVIQRALWNRSQEKLVFQDTGPGSSATGGTNGVQVITETLDDFIHANSIERVNFIKMDIEGAELNALTGAERTIRRDRPQLAISLYHDLGHFGSIPNWIANLDLGYQFYLDHFTIHEEETVLFARPAN